MIDIERERTKEVNKDLAPTAFELAWHAFQNTPIDLIADSDDETCKCLHNAIVSYLAATGRGVAQAPVNSDLLATYRDIFAEITAKAAPVCDPTSDDPERVRYYRIPVRPLHRAAGKLNFQMFDGETHLASAIQKIAQVRDATIEECAQVCEGGDWTRHATHHSPTKSCAIAIRALMGSVVSSTDKKAPPTDCEWADWICEYVAGGAVPSTSHVTGLVPDPNSASGYKLTSTNQGGGK